MPYRIDKCLCFGRRFDELKEIASENDVRSIEELQEFVLFGMNCMLCHPYVRRMLRTGQTCFSEIVTDADEPASDDSHETPSNPCD
ncbi:MAG: (2Fe-2S)-binding protein [Rhodothermales bacterium]|nr:(2Fe-2S)-binding protein [Rhodothermales bacterium]